MICYTFFLIINYMVDFQNTLPILLDQAPWISGFNWIEIWIYKS